jgi:peptidoglycan/xylan/chitin deacetylase (PgdA/CDA1 family)
MSAWPDGAQAAAVVTVNFDGESFEQPQLPGEPLWGRYSFGRYGAQAGVYRLLDALARFDVRATFFLPGWDIGRYPEVMADIAAAGHEPALMGWANEDWSALDPAAQRALLDRSEAAFSVAFGATPRGWRGPHGAEVSNGHGMRLAVPGSKLSGATRGLLAERGYLYDSSFCDDDLPYVVTDGQGRRLVELPVFQTASDRPYYQVHRAPEVVAEAWRDELSAMHAAGGLFNLALSPRGDWGSGRAVRVRAVVDSLQALRETPNLWLTTCGELANWALDAAQAGEARPA